MNPAEKEIILRAWEKLENPAIVKDVATKGKYINLSLEFLSKRLNLTMENTKEYFRHETDQYLHWLLQNGQIFRAEHILKNINRIPKYYFYEFIFENCTADENDGGVGGVGRNSGGDKSKEMILKYLCRNNEDFNNTERVEMDLLLEILKFIRTNVNLQKKYKEEFKRFSLEEIYKKNESIKMEIVLDILFLEKKIFVISMLNPEKKNEIWLYLVKNQLWNEIICWLNVTNNKNDRLINESQQQPQLMNNNKYYTELAKYLSSFEIDAVMIEKLKPYLCDAPKTIQFLLIKNGFTIGTDENIEQLLYQIFITETWEINQHILYEKHDELIKLIIKNGYLWILVLDYFTNEEIQKLCESSNQFKNELDLCLKIKSQNIVEINYSELSTFVSEYITKKDSNYFEKNPLVYLCELFLLKKSTKEILATEKTIQILNKIPLIKNFLEKLNQQYSYIPEGVLTKLLLRIKNFNLLDLYREIGTATDTDDPNNATTPTTTTTTTGEDKNNDRLNFSNKTLISKYSQREKLSYIFYIKQCRSTFAVYAFLLEQLQQYSQITTNQIMYACQLVSELAIKNYKDEDLFIHCMAFMEMLGVNSSTFRAQLKCLLHPSLIITPENNEFLLQNLLIQLNEENESSKLLNLQHFTRNDLDAMKIIFESHELKLPNQFLINIGEKFDWFQFIIFATYFNYSIANVFGILQSAANDNRKNTFFGIKRVAKNIATAIQYWESSSSSLSSSATGSPSGPSFPGNVPFLRSTSVTYREHRKKQHNKIEMGAPSGGCGDGSVSSSENHIQIKLCPSKFLNDTNNLFAIILKNTTKINSATEIQPFDYAAYKNLFKNNENNHNQHQNLLPHLKLLKNAITMNWPFLSILAASISENVSNSSKNNQILDYCWLTWLITITDFNVTKFDTTISTPSNFQSDAKQIIEYCITNGFLRILHQSIQIFYSTNPFKLFTEFLLQTSQLEFTPATTELLKQYLIEISISDDEENDNDNNETITNFANLSKEKQYHFSINLLVKHFRYSFNSEEYRQLLLQTLSDSGISDFMTGNIIDFCIIKEIHSIICFTGIELDMEILLPIVTAEETEHHYADYIEEFQKICKKLVTIREYRKAIQIADLLQFNKDNIIYENWCWEYEKNENFNLFECERDLERYTLSPELVINFYIRIAEKIPYENSKKYEILQLTLDFTKRHHLMTNECFNHDNIEHEMLISYLKNNITVTQLDIYYSDYFESIMKKERSVLYKTFLELKEMAGVDELIITTNKHELTELQIIKLNDLINKLLDDGDIVQALRIQAIFSHRPLDLHYLVFCMALAEGLATLYDLTGEQRQMLTDGVKSAISRFNKRTLRKRISQSNSISSSPTKPNYLESLDNSGIMEFEEIPSREKQDILEALQSLGARVNHGSKIAQRIVMTWRAAMYLDKEYVDILKTKDPYELLENAIEEECLHKLVVINDIMTVLEMTSNEIADFIGEKIVTCIIRSNFYLFKSANMTTTATMAMGGMLATSIGQPTGGGITTSLMTSSFTQQQQSTQIGQHTLWGFDLDKDFRLFLELCPNTTILGNCLLKFCDSIKLYRRLDKNTADSAAESAAIDKLPNVDNDNLTTSWNFQCLKKIMEENVLSHKKQNIITVELLIKAHECFVHECSMQGIAWVLHRAKLLNTTLANAKSWNLIVKMLMGIGRYRDMYYCFETLIKNEQFESLLGQSQDDERIHGLKQAIISYLYENCPDDTEKYRLTALHFFMYKEIGQMWETEANVLIAKILKDMKCDTEDGQQIILPKYAIVEQENGTTDVAYYLKCSGVLLSQLSQATDGFAQAAENYLLDNKLALAQRAANRAELIALQMNLVRSALENAGQLYLTSSSSTSSTSTSITTSTTTTTATTTAVTLPTSVLDIENDCSTSQPPSPSSLTPPRKIITCICVLNIRSSAVVKKFVNTTLSVPQALILSRAYPYEINWPEAICQQYIIQDNDNYLADFYDRIELTDLIIEMVVKNLQTVKITQKMEKKISKLVDMVQSVTLRYRLVSLLGLKGCIANLINGSGFYYLKDTNYGRSDV